MGDVVKLSLLMLVFYFIGVSIHETLHLIVIHLVGGSGILTAQGYGFHMQIIRSPGIFQAFVATVAPPLMASGILRGLCALETNKMFRASLMANYLILLFYAFLEFVYVVIEFVSKGEAPEFLVSPWLNLGVPTLISVWLIYRYNRTAQLLSVDR